MGYEVKQQFGNRGPEKLMGEFRTIDEARKFAFDKLKADAIYKINSIYRISQFDEIIEEWTPDKWQKIADQQQSSYLDEQNSSSGAKSQSSFRPSPLQSSPRPAGVPASSFKDEEDDGKSNSS
jgi:hypothetical protein